MPAYRIITSFGGKVVSKHSSLVAARKKAAQYGSKTPVDVWSSKGGTFGMGKVIAHYGKRTDVARNPIPGKEIRAQVCRLPSGQIQIKIPLRKRR